jgi:hypothetical protein
MHSFPTLARPVPVKIWEKYRRMRPAALAKGNTYIAEGV